MKSFLISIFLFSITSVHAEYRVYEYLVRSVNQIPQDKGTYIVTSTLFPSAYLAYHGGDSIQIDLLKSWLCPGYTGGLKKICSSPYEAFTKSVEKEN
jgi:hypothetical protein